MAARVCGKSPAGDGRAGRPADRAPRKRGPEIIRIEPGPGEVVTQDNLQAAKVWRDFLVGMYKAETGREVVVKLPGES